MEKDSKNTGKIWRVIKVFYFLITIPIVGIISILVLTEQRVYRGGAYFSVSDIYLGLLYAVFVLIGYVIITDFFKRITSYINSGEFEGVIPYWKIIISFGIPLVIVGAIFTASMLSFSDNLRKECTGKNEGFNDYGVCICNTGYIRENGMCKITLERSIISQQAISDIHAGMPMSEFDKLYPELSQNKGLFEQYAVDVKAGMPKEEGTKLYPDLFR